MCATPVLLEVLHPFLPPRGSPGRCGHGVGGSTMDGCGSRYSSVHRLYHSGFLTPFKANGIGQNVQRASFVRAQFNWTKSKNLGSIPRSMGILKLLLYLLILAIMSCYIIKDEAESWKRASCCFTVRAYDYFAFFGQHHLKLICP